MPTNIYLCPSDRRYACSWEGTSNDIVEHFIDEHEELLYGENRIAIDLLVPSENYLFFLDTELYLLQIKQIDNYLKIFLRYLGPPSIAEKLKFEIDLETNTKKLDKKDIQIKESYFEISLDVLRKCFEDISVIQCTVLVNDDIKSTSSDDGVVLDYEKSPRNPLGDNTQRFSENIKLGLDKEEEFPSGSDELDNESLLSAYLRSHRKLSDVESRSLWYITQDESHKPHLVQRSSSFATEERRRNSPKRSRSSLTPIRESDLDTSLRCTYCDEHISMPIFLCERKHNICGYCYRDFKLCKLCNSAITSERNLSLEKRSKGRKYTCRNKKFGCPERRDFDEIKDHEINCVFCSYNCPVEECGVNGSYKQIVSHLSLIHSSVKMFEAFIAVFHKYNELFLVSEKMGIFYCTMLVKDDKVIWTAKFAGPKERKFFCELKFKGRNFKYPILLTKNDENYVKEIPVSDMKEQKLKTKNSMLTITR